MCEETVVYFITAFQDLSTEYEKNYGNSELIEKDNNIDIDNCIWNISLFQTLSIYSHLMFNFIERNEKREALYVWK